LRQLILVRYLPLFLILLSPFSPLHLLCLIA